MTVNVARIRWDPGDSAGERTLSHCTPKGRFNRWVTDPQTVGEEAIGYGDGRGYVWAGRDDYIAAFELPHIGHADVALLDEFVQWANAFGIFSIDTGDVDDTSYEECQKAPGSRVSYSPPDPETMDHTLSVVALNIATVPAPLICRYL